VEPSAGRLARVLELMPPARVGPGVCAVCRTFVACDVDLCQACRRQPHALAAVLPISYSVGGGRLHRELRAYKDAPAEGIRDVASHTVATLLQAFLARHEACVAAVAGVRRFDLVTTVPSPTLRGDAARWRLRAITRCCPGVNARFRRLLAPGAASVVRHQWSPRRFEAVAPLGRIDVLLIDDTWTTGASAQAAAVALRRAGARHVALVVIGRHLSRGHADNAERVARLPSFDWDACATHRRGPAAADQPGGAAAPPEAPRESSAG
jgi:hypothetical protein